MENLFNRNKSFLKLSQSGMDGLVKSIILPKGRREEGWQKMEEHLETFMFGDIKECSEEAVNRNHMKLTKESIVTRSGGLSKNDVISDGTQVSHTQKSKEPKDTWGCVVVCERQVVYQSWMSIERCISRWLKKKIHLTPYQNNKAFFVCFSSEEATRIANQGNIPLEGQPDILLYEWIPGFLNNTKKVVSYEG